MVHGEGRCSRRAGKKEILKRESQYIERSSGVAKTIGGKRGNERKTKELQNVCQVERREGFVERHE